MVDPKAGTFSAYLEYAQRGDQAPSERAPLSFSILAALVKDFPTEGAPMGNLADRSHMTAGAFRDSLKKLVDSGFIEISGPALSETVKLTEKGRETAALL